MTVNNSDSNDASEQSGRGAAPPSTANLPQPVAPGEPGSGVNDASEYAGQAGYGGLRPMRLTDNDRNRARDAHEHLVGERGGLSHYGEIDSSVQEKRVASDVPVSDSDSNGT